MASKKRRRVQSPKNGGNPIMAKSREFRFTESNMSGERFNRNGERAAMQRGRYDFS